MTHFDLESGADYTALCSAVTLQSNKNGFFQHIVDSVESFLDESWLNDFGKLKSNKERIKKCLTHKRVGIILYTPNKTR
jgi:hypothetical protein